MPTAQAQSPHTCPFGRPPGAVTEVTLLLPDDRLDALHAAAAARGVTTGALIRRILDDYLSAGPDCSGRTPGSWGEFMGKPPVSSR